MENKIQKPTACFVDIDSTLTVHNKPSIVSKRNIEALKKAQEQGIFIVLATGRDERGLSAIHKQIKLNEYGRFLIAINGSTLEDTHANHRFYEKAIDKSIASQVISFAQEQGLGIRFPTDPKFYVKNHHPKYFILRLLSSFRYKKYKHIQNHNDIDTRKIGILVKNKSKLQEVKLSFKNKFPDLEMTETGSGYYLEINAPGVSKAFAAQELAKHNNWDLSNCIAIGDSMNDYELFKVVGCSFAMENALMPLKKIATKITATAQEDGVAQVIEKYLN